MLGELSRVLNQKLGLPNETIDETIAFLRRQATVVNDGHDGFQRA